MSRNRATGFIGLVAVTGAFAAACPREAFAANTTTPFTWSKYLAKDGKQYNYPQWNEIVGGKRDLRLAQGTLSFAQTPAVTKVVFKVYRHGAQGGWNATPVISYTLDPNPTYTGFPINGWTLVGRDNNPDAMQPKAQFDEGEEILMVWEVTTTDNSGTKTVSNVMLVVTVEYHAS